MSNPQTFEEWWSGNYKRWNRATGTPGWEDTIQYEGHEQAQAAWNACQPEIDALKVELAEYRTELEHQRERWSNLLKDQTEDHQTEIDALKGRLEAVRKLAESLRARRRYEMANEVLAVLGADPKEQT